MCPIAHDLSLIKPADPWNRLIKHKVFINLGHQYALALQIPKYNSVLMQTFKRLPNFICDFLDPALLDILVVFVDKIKKSHFGVQFQAQVNVVLVFKKVF